MNLFDPSRPSNSLGPLILDSHGRGAANVPPLHIEPRNGGGFILRAYLPTEHNNYRARETVVESLDSTYAEYVADPEAFFAKHFRYDPAYRDAKSRARPLTLDFGDE